MTGMHRIKAGRGPALSLVNYMKCLKLTSMQVLPGTDGETATQGLDNLGARCAEYYKQGVGHLPLHLPLPLHLSLHPYDHGVFVVAGPGQAAPSFDIDMPLRGGTQNCTVLVPVVLTTVTQHLRAFVISEMLYHGCKQQAGHQHGLPSREATVGPLS